MVHKLLVGTVEFFQQHLVKQLVVLLVSIGLVIHVCFHSQYKQQIVMDIMSFILFQHHNVIGVIVLSNLIQWEKKLYLKDFFSD